MEIHKRLFVKIIFLISFISSIKTEPCDKIDCISSITQDDCNLYEVLIPKHTLDNCCPGCKSGGKICSKCTEDADCVNGLKCTGIKIKEIEAKRCSFDRTSCYHFAQIRDDKKIRWTPTCNLNGDYKEVQCRGDMVSGRCFCFSKTGNRIFGWDWRHNAENMTCACSRKKHELESKGRYYTLHCQQNGNFEELQCDSGACFCVEPMTGKLQKGTFVVAEYMWTKLPCYNETLHGERYLRQCESIAFAEDKIYETFTLHGTYDAPLSLTLCRYDGSFGPIEIEGKQSKCIWNDGSKLGTYTALASNWKQTDCACAYDEKLFELNNLAFKLSCETTGSYEPLQYQHEKYFCVDTLGYNITEFEPEQEKGDRYRYDNIQTEWYCASM